MANLSFFGSTVDAIAPQEQNVLSQYRQHNWNVEAANAAAAERARALSMEAFARAQQNEQHQAQQDYANQVNLLHFADRSRRENEGEQRRQFEWNTGRTDRATELTADNAVRLAQFGQRTAENEQKNFATLQSQIMAGQVRGLDEAWAYIPKTPNNVIRVNKLLDTFKKELTQKTLEDYDKATAAVQADQLAGIIKVKGAAITDKDKEAAMWLDPQTLTLIPRKVGSVIPGARWDYDKKKWTIEPEDGSSFSPVLGAVRQSEGGLDLSRFATPTRAVTNPQVSNQGGGYFPAATQPRVDLSQFRTGTNAPAVMQPATERPIGTQAEYSALSSGARFVWVYPDGRRRAGVKP